MMRDEIESVILIVHCIFVSMLSLKTGYGWQEISIRTMSIQIAFSAYFRSLDANIMIQSLEQLYFWNSILVRGA